MNLGWFLSSLVALLAAGGVTGCLQGYVMTRRCIYKVDELIESNAPAERMQPFIRQAFGAQPDFKAPENIQYSGCFFFLPLVIVYTWSLIAVGTSVGGGVVLAAIAATACCLGIGVLAKRIVGQRAHLAELKRMLIERAPEQWRDLEVIWKGQKKQTATRQKQDGLARHFGTLKRAKPGSEKFNEAVKAVAHFPSPEVAQALKAAIDRIERDVIRQFGDMEYGEYLPLTDARDAYNRVQAQLSRSPKTSPLDKMTQLCDLRRPGQVHKECNKMGQSGVLALVRVLRDERGEAPEIAAEVLGRIGGADARKGLLDKLRTDTSVSAKPWLRNPIVAALKKLGAEDDLRELGYM